MWVCIGTDSPIVYFGTYLHIEGDGKLQTEFTLPTLQTRPVRLSEFKQRSLNYDGKSQQCKGFKSRSSEPNSQKLLGWPSANQDGHRDATCNLCSVVPMFRLKGYRDVPAQGPGLHG